MRWRRPATFTLSRGPRPAIKFTLPAVLQAHQSPRIPDWPRDFEPGLSLQGWGPEGLVNPYTLLPAVQSIDAYGRGGDSNDYTVNEGAGAMRAYQDMLYGLARNDPQKKAHLREALRLYCKLDTLAMVIIWEHWRTAPATDWSV